MEEQQHFEAEVKFLYKKFNILDKPSTKILFEFCEFDSTRAYKVLAIGKTLRSPACIIETIVKNPQKSEEYLDALVKRYDNQIGEPVDLPTQNNQNKKKSVTLIPKLQFEFFQDVPQDTIGTIMSYLDPYSFKRLTFTNTTFYKIGKAQSLSELYKQICKVLFSTNEPGLPKDCRFESVRKYVLKHPEQFFPYYNNFKNAVTNNLRNYIWKMQPSELKLSTSYYKQFGSYENLFTKCPRVNLNGYYICKHKYVKVGQKDHNHFVTPIHIIYYFRYIRFLEDGTVIYHVSNKKIKPQDAVKVLSKDCLDQQNPFVIIGEYMQYKNVVYMKGVKDNTVFGYELQINSTQNKICNQLKVLDYKLELIDNSYMTQTLYKANPNREELTFEYCWNEGIMAQNSPRIQACSL